MGDFLKPAATAIPSATSAPAEQKPKPLIFNGVPLELIEYFSLDMRDISERTSKQINEIYDFVSPDVKSMGEVLMEIRLIERRLGNPAIGETRYGRVWGWLKINNRIKDLEKQRGAFEQ